MQNDQTLQTLICYANNASLEIHQIWIELFATSSHLREIMYYEGILIKNLPHSPYHCPNLGKVDIRQAHLRFKNLRKNMPFRPCFDHLLIVK